MFYRRKVLLSLLQLFDGQIEKIALQKLLFLFTIEQKTAIYDFIPYRFGSYSISANADLAAMARAKLVEENQKSFRKIDKCNYLNKLSLDDQFALIEVKRKFGNQSSRELMKFTYEHFYYYAINSKTAPNILSQVDYEKVLKAKPNSNEVILFTIGYEGISLEEYLNRLIKNDVKLLVDVRFNPVSRKFGFSKANLTKYCESLHIQYKHIPEVGIRSEYRKELKTQKDYSDLFQTYETGTLTKTRNQQSELVELLEKERRIALTCFESDVGKCHRSHLANSLVELCTWKFELKHI